MDELVRIIVNILSILIVLHVILSYVLPPYHAVREALARIVEPMLAPIRNALPSTGPLDLSPLILLLVIHLIGRLLMGVFI
jgi:YggT family protein